MVLTEDQINSYTILYNENTIPNISPEASTIHTTAMNAFNDMKSKLTTMTTDLNDLNNRRNEYNALVAKKRYNELLLRMYTSYYNIALKNKQNAQNSLDKRRNTSCWFPVGSTCKNSVTQWKNEVSKFNGIYNRANITKTNATNAFNSSVLEVTAALGPYTNSQTKYNQSERAYLLAETEFIRVNTLNVNQRTFDVNYFLDKSNTLTQKFDAYGQFIANDILTSNKNDIAQQSKGVSAESVLAEGNDTTLYNKINNITSLENRFESIYLNNCPVDNTAIDSTGFVSCGLNESYSSFQNASLFNKNISNEIMSKIPTTDPRFEKVNEVNNQINEKYNWDYLSEKFNSAATGPTEFSKYNQSEIRNRYVSNQEYIEKAYNNCDDKMNSLNSYNPEEKPFCLVDKYDIADNTCKKALSKSLIYKNEESQNELNNIWKNVRDSILGNTIQQNDITLSNATESCEKWISIFNVWEAAEQEAIAKPCLPERPVQSTNDPVILKITEDWNRAASNYIGQLLTRLEIIQKYIEKYPNILELKTENVSFGPSSIGASMMVKTNKDQTMGFAPVKYLEMLIPNGAQGEPGIKGIEGIQGEPGLTGNRGQIGKTGNPKISSMFE